MIIESPTFTVYYGNFMLELNNARLYHTTNETNKISQSDPTET